MAEDQREPAKAQKSNRVSNGDAKRRRPRKASKAQQNPSGGDRKATRAKTAGKASKVGNAAKASQKGGERSYGLSSEELKPLLADAEAAKKFPNPFRPSSLYGCIVLALADLGVNKEHSFKAVKAEVAQLMGREGWAEFGCFGVRLICFAERQADGGSHLPFL